MLLNLPPLARVMHTLDPADMLAVYQNPELPIAGVLLQRLNAILGGPLGIAHSDTNVKLISIELLGLLSARLFSDARAELFQDGAATKGLFTAA